MRNIRKEIKQSVINWWKKNFHFSHISRNQKAGIGILAILSLVVIVVLETHPVPEHETIQWKRDSTEQARINYKIRRDSLNHHYDSVQHRVDSIFHRMDSISSYWGDYYDSIDIVRKERRHLYDSIQALPRAARIHYYDSINHRDTLHFNDTIRTWSDSVSYIVRIKKDTVLELNSADTTQLMYIRGIGPKTADKIVRYRYKLGGYASVDQLREINVNDTILRHFIVCPDSIKPIRINYLIFEKIVQHPYFHYAQAKELTEYRRRHGKWKNWEQIRKRNIFTPAEEERVKPYLSFD